ncbi:MAG TPA: membrane dipeptidase, partial [Ktedonobacterales bacterium]
MFIVDGHEDIAMNALQHGRDVRLTVAEIREAEAAREPDPSLPHTGPDDAAMVGLPEHRLGGVGLVFSTIFTLPDPDPTVPTEKGLQQLLYYHDLARQPVGVRLITDAGGLDSLIHDWELAPTVDQRPVGFMMLMEGADPVSKPSELHEWIAGGVRMIGLAWKGTRYAGGTGQPGP